MSATSRQLNEAITRFSNLRKEKRTSLLTSVEVQFVHMAQGGDGTAAMEGEIRQTYYPTWDTKDFQTVCRVMCWDYSKRY